MAPDCATQRMPSVQRHGGHRRLSLMRLWRTRQEGLRDPDFLALSEAYAANQLGHDTTMWYHSQAW